MAQGTWFSNRWRIATAILALLVAIATAWRAWTVLVLPDAIPTRDTADYIARALRMLDAFDRHVPRAALHELVRPDMHPSGWPALLAGWFHLFGRSMEAARAAPLALEFLGVVLAGWTGHRLVPGRGAAAGLGAGLLAMMTTEHLRLLTAPMTEPLALVATLLALHALRDLGTDLRRWPHLRFGVLVTAAGLVRYNLPPMLLAPAVWLTLWHHRRNPRALLSPLPLLWVLPSAMVVLAAQVVRPKTIPTIADFLRNLDSNIPFWSSENLAWTFTTFASDYVGSTPVAAGLALLGALALFPWRLRLGPVELSSEPARVRHLQAFVLVALLAVTLHPYKLPRTLHAVVPVGALATGLAFARSRTTIPLLSRGVAVMGLSAALAWGGVQLGPRLPSLAARAEFVHDPTSTAILERATAFAAEGAWIRLVTYSTRLSYRAVEVHLRLDRLPAFMELDPPLRNSCQERAPGCLDTLRQAVGRSAKGRTLWLYVMDAGGADPKAAEARRKAGLAFEKEAAARGLRVVDRVESADGSLYGAFWDAKQGMDRGRPARR